MDEILSICISGNTGRDGCWRSSRRRIGGMRYVEQGNVVKYQEERQEPEKDTVVT